MRTIEENMKKIRKGDDVVVICGKDKGKRGVVQRIESLNYVVIQGLNKVKKHVHPNPAKGTVGGITEIEKPVHISNIAIYNAATKKADRVGFKLDDGNKVRYYKSSSEPINS